MSATTPGSGYGNSRDFPHRIECWTILEILQLHEANDYWYLAPRPVSISRRGEPLLRLRLQSLDMSTARFSPAATFLRNSRLFALPQALSGPTPQASTELVASSDTATAPWPTQAAIATPLASQVLGDWGLKRPLPQKSAGKHVASTIRIQRAIDTDEHIADFESSADHVSTLKKLQELRLALTLPKRSNVSVAEPSQDSAFQAHTDHTRPTFQSPTYQIQDGVWPNLSAEAMEQAQPRSLRRGIEISKDRAAKRRAAENERRREAGQAPLRTGDANLKDPLRYRHNGPWLAGMKGDEFERWLEKSVSGRTAEFRGLVRTELESQRRASARAAAMDAGEPLDEAALMKRSSVTEEDLTNRMRELRANPSLFAPLIAKMFDLPEGPRLAHVQKSRQAGQWPYGRTTFTSDHYRDNGPPRTHPSAGLSYLGSRLSQNDAEYGPQEGTSTQIGRILKSNRAAGSMILTHTIGIAGVVGINEQPRSLTNSYSPEKNNTRNVPLRPKAIAVTAEGTIALTAQDDGSNYKLVGGKLLRNDKAAFIEELEEGELYEPLASRRAAAQRGVLPPLDRGPPAKVVNRQPERSPEAEAAVDSFAELFK